ncbi:lycopene cyclase family protein [Corynebacterium sp. CCM 9203]|uniref:lycopene cyclase family protein n=1 Tax=Corynebacterium sp. CCM 9203 TaxID=3057615 RepID=UPI0035267C1E
MASRNILSTAFDTTGTGISGTGLTTTQGGTVSEMATPARHGGNTPGQSQFDMIVVGLGPAGAALAHRAHRRGWNVLGVDPREEWPNTYGIFSDELPDWLPDPPAAARSIPVIIGARVYTPGREYLILDNQKLRNRFLTFPVLISRATTVARHHVCADGHTMQARVVIDARGVDPGRASAFQQAFGVVIDDDAPPVWMDLRQVPDTTEATFHYQIPVSGGVLHQETVLVRNSRLPWSELETALRQRIGDFTAHRIVRSEAVLIPMDRNSRRPVIDGPVPFGARAGFITPISGFSVATSLSLVEPTLDALAAAAMSGGTPQKLPWHTFRYRTDRYLMRMGQRVLKDLDKYEFPDFMELVFRLDTSSQRRFLSPGDPVGTLRGMMRIFIHSDTRLRFRILCSLSGVGGTGRARFS